MFTMGIDSWWLDATEPELSRKDYGINWFDFWTGELLQGGQKVAKKTPVDIINY